jgi:hypothetical protein
MGRSKRRMNKMADNAEQPPQGERFSLVYLERSEPTDDSEQMRHRIGALVHDFQKLREDLENEIERRIGITVAYGRRWPGRLKEITLPQVLM